MARRENLSLSDVEGRTAGPPAKDRLLPLLLVAPALAMVLALFVYPLVL